MSAMPQTEASCLLAGGTLYRVRVGLTSAADDAPLVFAGFKKGAFSIYFGDAPIYHFDLEGRWQRAFVDSTHYLKGLDTRVHAIDRVREGPNLVLRRRRLHDDETQEIDLGVRGVALDLLQELDHGHLDYQEPPPGKAQPLDAARLRQFLQRIASWDADAWDAHRSAYQAAYGPLPFLPPECQNAVVLQATCGHEDGTAFAAGPAAEHSIRTPVAFARHVDQVVRLVGRRLEQSRLVFLGGSDVLRRPTEEVIQFLDVINQRLPIAVDRSPATGDLIEEAQIDGVHAFLDEFSASLPGAESLRAYHDRHLVHVSLGVESGDAGFRRLYGRAWSDEDLRSFVSDLKTAGIGLSLLTLVGAGGPEHSAKHVAGTSQLLASLRLARGDMVFLLDVNELRREDLTGKGVGPLIGEAWRAQQAALKQALAPLQERGVKVLPYSLEKQWS
jgi:hypothetical protein